MPIVSNSGGSGGGAVTITGPLGTRPGAQSLSVVLPNDQTVPVSIAQTVAVSAAALPLPANAAAETGGNLASQTTLLTTLAGAVSAAKMAVKSAANDIVDLATLLTRFPAALTGAGWFQVSVRGGANVAVTQATSTGTAATLLAARATRKRAIIRNTDATATIWVGPATVTTASWPVKPGDSFEATWPGLIQVIDNGTHTAANAIVCWDEYD